MHQTPIYSLRLVRDGSVATDRLPRMTRPDEVFHLIRTLIADKTQENLIVLMLDASKRVIGISTIYVGTIDTIIYRLAEVFRPAILGMAHGIIIAHNHPGNDPNPSYADKIAMQEAVKAGKLLGIEVVDCVIVAHDAEISFKGQGYL